MVVVFMMASNIQQEYYYFSVHSFIYDFEQFKYANCSHLIAKFVEAVLVLFIKLTTAPMPQQNLLFEYL